MIPRELRQNNIVKIRTKFLIKSKSSIKNVPKGINNIRYIIIKYFINKVLSPSIKFPPLIKTIKQNVTKALLKYVFDNKLSTNSIFVVLISKFKTCEKKIIKINCKKNLKLTLLSFFRSDKSLLKKWKINREISSIHLLSKKNDKIKIE